MKGSYIEYTGHTCTSPCVHLQPVLVYGMAPQPPGVSLTSPLYSLSLVACGPTLALPVTFLYREGVSAHTHFSQQGFLAMALPSSPRKHARNIVLPLSENRGLGEWCVHTCMPVQVGVGGGHCLGPPSK